MRFIKKNSSLIVSAIIILISITVVLVILFVNDTNNKVKNDKTQEKTYEEKFPFLRELDFGDDFKGITTPIKDGWSLYENEIFGFKVEYPSHRTPRERFYDSGNSLFGRSYNVDLSGGEFEVAYVIIKPSRFRTIEEWIKNDPEYKSHAQNYVFVRRKISGVNAITKYYVPEFPPITDSQILRTTYVIKNNILYSIITRDISSEEYERILNSFGFILD